MPEQAGDWPDVSIVAPMRNEEKYIATCIESVLQQDYPRDKLEMIIADGQSDDRSREIVEAYAREYPFIHLIDNPRRTAGPGLNAAIARATGKYILRMDIHAEYAPDYVRQCVRFSELSKAENVGGPLITLPNGDSLMARCVSAITSHRLVVGGSAFRTSREPQYSDGCFFGTWPREVFEKVGGFNEALTRHQDNEFNSRVMRYGGKILQVPQIVVKYYNQATLRGLCRQAWRNGVWHPLSFVANPAAFKVRYVAPFLFVSWLLLFGALSLVHWLFLIPLLMAVVPYALFLGLVTTQVVRQHGIDLLPVIPFSVFCYHLAYGLGMFVGIWRFILTGRKYREAARLGSTIPDPQNPPTLGTRALPLEEVLEQAGRDHDPAVDG